MIACSTILITSLYMAVALVAVFAWGSLVTNNSNILYIIPVDIYFVNYLCLILSICITLMYPVINYPILLAYEAIIKLI